MQRTHARVKNSDTNSSVFGATLLALMTEDYGLDELAHMPLTDFTSLLQEKETADLKSGRISENNSTSNYNVLPFK